MAAFRTKSFNSLFFLFCLLTVLQSCQQSQVLETVTVAEFSDFVDATGYQTDAEKYGWSIVQKTIYEYDVVEGATWRLPDGKSESKVNEPVTQVSHADAVAYCEWAGTTLPSYEQFWQLVEADERAVIMNTNRIHPVAEINVVGNTWDITISENSRGEIRLAGGSYLCAPTTCNGTNPDRVLYVSKDTGNSHISFSVIRSRN